MKPPSHPIAFRAHLDLPFADAMKKVKEALKAQGFGVLTEIDVQATLEEKLDEDFRPYHILGACHPPLAHRALSSDLDIGLLLPCNVIVYEAEGAGTDVALLDPLAVLGLAHSPQIEPIAQEAHGRIRHVAEALAN